LFDGEGLYLFVQPSGAKYWCWKYRYAGREKLLALGKYPIIKLADARDKQEQARGQLLAGTDPSTARKAAKLATRLRGQNTFEAVTREWHGKMVDAWSPSHAAKVLASLERFRPKADNFSRQLLREARFLCPGPARKAAC
jgi:hypothetical protein